MKDVKKDLSNSSNESVSGLSRRRFLGFAGGLAGAGMIISSCNKDDDTVPSDGTIDLGTNDEGLLNLIFVMQQIEADFYQKANERPYIGINESNKTLLGHILKHEIIHREFFRKLLGGLGTTVETNFDAVRFTDVNSVVAHAKIIEDTLVSALNAMGRLMIAPENVELVLKLASVEARHISYISTLRDNDSFADVTDANGLETGSLPSNVVLIINRYLNTKVSGNNLPNK